MTNKEILQANLLDIIFENRNKEYGAYALRNGYDKRLLKALGIGLGLVLLLVLVNFLKIANAGPMINDRGSEGATITPVEFTPEKKVEPEKPVTKSKAVEKIETIQNTTIKIVPNDKVDNPVPSNTELDGKLTSTETSSGEPYTNQINGDPAPANNGNGEEIKPVEPEKTIIIREQAPEYPGGTAALIEFMKRNLVTPSDLDIGDKKVVKVKFVVGKDGVISDITIIESPGKDYDREVSRVVKKMPRWKPGIQNDINVAVAYVLPVTFMGVEE
jgi:periplasmic protein TonB